jgi:predicted membrane protein
MKWAGAIVLALLGFAFMRVRRHPMKSALAFGGGILGIIIVLSIIKYALF